MRLAAGPLQQEQHGLQRVGVYFRSSSSSSTQSANGCGGLRLQQKRQQEESLVESMPLSLCLSQSLSYSCGFSCDTPSLCLQL